MAEGWDKARDISRRVGRGLAGAGRASWRAGRATATGTKRASVATARGAHKVGKATRRLTHANGADRTGLGRLIELSIGNSAADALVTVALASTVFFGVPVGEARGPVALYLVITMIPFALTAPFVGPILDKFRSGRRYVIAGTLFGRGLLCFAMAAAVGPGDLPTLFAGALGVLVLSKAFNVSRAAIMPNVLPADITLVSANARVALFSLVTAGIAVPIAAGLTAWLGSAAMLRVAMVAFIVVGVFAVRLPRHVDSPDLEEEEPPEGGRAERWRSLLNVGPTVAEAMWANVAVRLFSGFLLFFMLFLVQDEGAPWLKVKDTFFDVPKTIGLLALAAGLGGLIGAAVANWARNHSPQLIVLLTLGLTAATTVATAIFFNLWMAVAIAIVTAFSQELGKLALDAIVQREIGEEVRSSTFGVVEALLQLAWVFGGLIGLLLSLTEYGPPGFITLSVVLFAWMIWLLIRRRKRIKAVNAQVRAQHPPSGPQPQPQPSSSSSEEDDTTQEAWTDEPAAQEAWAEEPPEEQPGKVDRTKPLTNPFG